MIFFLIRNRFRFLFSVLASMTLALTTPASATMIYNDWTSEGGTDSPNYVVTVTENAGTLDFDMTIDPWNAEFLAFYLDLGEYTVNAGDLILGPVTSAPTTGAVVSILDTDCSAGCNTGGGANLNGLDPPLADPDSDWELAIGLGGSGFEGYQSFSFNLSSSSQTFTEAMLGVAGARAQTYCDSGGTITDGSSSCGGSDKSWGATSSTPSPVPEPGVLALMGIGMIGLVGVRRERRGKS